MYKAVAKVWRDGRCLECSVLRALQSLSRFFLHQNDANITKHEVSIKAVCASKETMEFPTLCGKEIFPKHKILASGDASMPEVKDVCV